MARDATPSREARLRAALKANIARRKAQGRARAAEPEAGGPVADGPRHAADECGDRDGQKTGAAAMEPDRAANGDERKDGADG